MFHDVTTAMQDAPSGPVETVRVKLPPSFSRTNPAHATAVTGKVNEAHGGGFTLSHIDGEFGVFTRRSATTEVVRGADDSFFVKLPNGTKPTDGDRMAATLQDQHPGYFLTKFDPHNGRAGLTRLSEDMVRCRDAVAVVIGAKPWDVTIVKTADGGYLLGLTNKYVPSKHDERLNEVASLVVGRFGWYALTDPPKLTVRMVPADPPTFPDVIPLPLENLGRGTLDRTPFGLKLPDIGQTVGDAAHIDWTMSPHLLLGGLPRAGKTVSLNDIIADALSNGAELVIIDTPDKAVDFTWAKPYVRPGGWGCDGLRSSVTALKLAHEELKRRADILKEQGLENWYRIPEAQRFKPILVVVDEVSMLLMTDRIPAGVDKKTPEVQEIILRNLMKFRVQKTIYDIMAEMGFVGARVILSSQVTNAATGLPPTMKALIGNKALQGSNPSKTQRDQAFNVSAQVPVVPENLRGGGLAAKGVGAAELEGQDPFIYKPYFATTQAIAARLAELGLPTTDRPEPTIEEMDRLCPIGEPEDSEPEADILGSDRTPSGKPLDPKYGPVTVLDDDGRRLKGAAAAARASKALASDAPPPCPSCDRPIQPDGSCGCSW